MRAPEEDPRPADEIRSRPRDAQLRANLRDIRKHFGESHLEPLLDLAFDWLWETDEAHRWTWVSDRCAAITGVPASAILGRSSIQSLTRKAAANPAIAAHLALIAAHQPFRDVLLELRNGNPACRWIAVSGVPVFGADGRFTGYRGMTRNVTAMVEALGDPAGYDVAADLRQAADADTVAAAERMRSAMDYVPEAMVVYDADGRVQFYNEALLTIYRGLEDVVRPGMQASDIVDAGLQRNLFDLGGSTPEEFRKAILEPETVAGASSATFRFADGRWIMHRDYVAPDGCRVGVCTDITELKEKEAAAERARAEAEAAKTRLQSAIDAMEDSFVLWDRDDRLVACNAAYLRQFDMLPRMKLGSTSAELLEMLCDSAADPETSRRDLDGLARQLSVRRPEEDTEVVEQLPDGRWILSRDQITPIGDRVAIRTDITEMKTREARLAHANAVMRGILLDVQGALDGMTMGVLLLDPELRVETMNRAFRQLWQLGDHEAPAGTPMRAVFDLPSVRALYAVPADEQGAYFDARTQAMRTGKASSGELRRTDGSTIQFSMTRLSSGKQLVCHYDVTALKDREAALEGALERAGLIEAALDAVSDPVFLKDSELRYVFANAAFARLSGVPAGALIGKRATDVFEPRWAEASERDEREVLATGKALEIDDDPDRHGDGRFRILRKDVVEIGVGKRYIAGFLFDVTDIRRREHEAEEARRRLAHVLETLPAGVVIYDENDLFLLSNRKIVDGLPGIGHLLKPGVPLRTILKAGHACGYFRYPNDPDMTALYDSDPDVWLERAVERYHVPHAVMERKNPDGTWHQVFDARTSDGFFVGVRVDITELKAREAALREAEQRAVLADRAKSEFLANMSHEIRTPMNGVLGMAELLSKTQLDIKQKTFTDIIVKSGNALLTIINDILDFSKIDAGQLVLDPLPFDLAESVEDVATLMSTRAKEKELELIVRVDPALPRTVVGDAGRLRQIVTNLVGNAVKFTDCGHVLVAVSGSVDGGTARLRFEVEDTGIGIPADMIDQVFEKFSQVDGSSTRRHEGTGLGLAITSRLVALMGGRIGVESTVGKGSVFWFEIDLPIGQSAGRGGLLRVDVTGARVLVIDDNAVNRAILMEQLTAWGFDACAACDGREGLAVMHETARLGLQVDCVVLDYQMPGMSGGEVAAEIRATPSIAQTPIIMLTSVDQPLSGMQNRELAIAMQLIKPVRSAALFESLSATMQRRAARPQPEPALQLPAISTESSLAPLPAAPSRGAAEIAADDDWARWEDGRVDILVAEDNEVNQLVFAQILGETGHAFEIVRNGERAVEAWRRMKPSLILMDVSMPQMNGLEATEAIRAEEAAGSRVPIVGVTAHALKGDRERCLEAGMDDYLPKPISPKALRGKIERWLSGAAEERASAAG